MFNDMFLVIKRIKLDIFEEVCIELVLLERIGLLSFYENLQESWFSKSGDKAQYGRKSEPKKYTRTKCN